MSRRSSCGWFAQRGMLKSLHQEVFRVVQAGAFQGLFAQLGNGAQQCHRGLVEMPRRVPCHAEQPDDCAGRVLERYGRQRAELVGDEKFCDGVGIVVHLLGDVFEQDPLAVEDRAPGWAVRVDRHRATLGQRRRQFLVDHGLQHLLAVVEDAHAGRQRRRAVVAPRCGRHRQRQPSCGPLRASGPGRRCGHADWRPAACWRCA